MSPEALRGEELDARADIWSFGVLLYEMLAGRRPFAGEQIMAVITAILSDPIPNITPFCPDIHPSLDLLLSQMLSKEAHNRPTSMRQVAATLESIQYKLRQ